MHKLLTLDQATRTSGWAVFYDGELTAYGKFHAEQDDMGERLYYIKTQVENLIDKYDINEVVFEDIQLQDNVVNNVLTFKKLAEVFGVIYEYLEERKIPHDAVLAEVWRKGLGITGGQRADKKRRTQLYVNQMYGIKATQDECDAIGIGSFITKKPKIEMKPNEDGWLDWSK